MTVSGTQNDVAQFLEQARGDEACFDFGRFVPRPTAGENRVDDSGREGSDGDVEWARKHWGTKWNASSPAIEEHFDLPGGSEASLSFATAWTPPVPVILAASEQFPKLTFLLRYYECGAGFHGRMEAQAGRILEHHEGPYFGDRGG